MPVEVSVGWAVGSAPPSRSPTPPPHASPAARSSLSSPRRLAPLPTGASLRFELATAPRPSPHRCLFTLFELLIGRVPAGAMAGADACEAQKASNEARVQDVEHKVEYAREEGRPIEESEDGHQHLHAVDKTRRQDGRVGGLCRRG